MILSPHNAAEREKTMAIEIKESGPSEEEVEAMIGRGKVRVEEARVEEGKFGQQIRLSLLHKKGAVFAAWISATRPKIEEVCRCFGVKSPARGETFDETGLVGKVGEIRLSTKTDSKGILRPKIDAWLEAKVETVTTKPVAAPQQDGDEASEIPF